MVDTEVAASVIDARVQTTNGYGSRLVVLERTGATTGRLSVSIYGSPAVNQLVQASVALPASWLPGETPINFINEGVQQFLVRTDFDVYLTLGQSGSWTKVATNVRAVFDGGLVLQNDGTLLRVLGGGGVETLPMRGNPNLRFATRTVFSDEGTMVCPDGSICHVVQRLNLLDTSVTTLAVGRFVTDVETNPLRFGWPTVRDGQVDLAWPARRVNLIP
jgi:hypothetical protein